MKALLSTFLLLACASAFASSVWVPIDKKSMVVGRFAVSTQISKSARGRTHFRVSFRMTEGRWPKWVRAQLSHLTIAKSSIEDVPIRRLRLAGEGVGRVVEFDVSGSEVPRLSFELLEFGESGGVPMPSMTAYYFPLRHPPTE